jgi:DNA-binding NarL/FixJ family response regulator
VLRLGLVSSSPLVRAGLRAGLAQQPGLEVAFESLSLEAAREGGASQADVLIVEAELEPDPRLLDALLHGPPTVLLWSGESARAGEWLADGLTVLPVHASIDTVAAAAHAAAAGLVAALPALWRASLRWVRAGERAAGESMEPITAREREVLAQMAQGLGNREIAERLRISPHTAKFHVGQVIAKLQARSRAHAVAKAASQGLLTEQE